MPNPYYNADTLGVVRVVVEGAVVAGGRRYLGFFRVNAMRMVYAATTQTVASRIFGEGPVLFEEYNRDTLPEILALMQRMDTLNQAQEMIQRFRRENNNTPPIGASVGVADSVLRDWFSHNAV